MTSLATDKIMKHKGFGLLIHKPLTQGLLILAMANAVYAEDDRSRIEKVIESSDDSPVYDVAEWGIKNGCIANTRIKQVDFISNHSGIMELSGGRKVMVTMRNNCSGIRNEGYVHKPINGKFCEGDMLRVIHYGTVCIVDTISPYMAASEN